MWVISFDCNSKVASEHNIYDKISTKLIGKKSKVNFEWNQGSVYTTNFGLSMIHKGIEEIRKIPYIKDAIKDIRVFQMLDGSDFTILVINKN